MKLHIIALGGLCGALVSGAITFVWTSTHKPDPLVERVCTDLQNHADAWQRIDSDFYVHDHIGLRDPDNYISMCYASVNEDGSIHCGDLIFAKSEYARHRLNKCFEQSITTRDKQRARDELSAAIK